MTTLLRFMLLIGTATMTLVTLIGYVHNNGLDIWKPTEESQRLVINSQLKLDMSFELPVSTAKPLSIISQTLFPVAGLVHNYSMDADLGMIVANILSKNDRKCIQSFITEYEKKCHNSVRPNLKNVPNKWREKVSSAAIDEVLLCPCVSKLLLGPQSLSTDAMRSPLTVDESLRRHDPAMVSGRWYPTDCIARQRVAIVIPYRNRVEHLRQLVYALHPMLQRQQLDYTIFVIEQFKPRLFNRASLLNVGYKESQSIGAFDCYIFHDVDMIPIDDRNFYTCSPTPRHMGKFRATRKFSYPTYFGGVLAIRSEQFEMVNGFSNAFFGWGGEDDDFRNRIRAKHLSPTPRFPKCVSMYWTPFHKRDSGNPSGDKNRRRSGRTFHPMRYKRIGLNTVQYTVEKKEQHLLYTKITVSLVELSE